MGTIRMVFSFATFLFCFLLVDKIRADEFPIRDEADEVLDVKRAPLLLVEVEETDGGDGMSGFEDPFRSLILRHKQMMGRALRFADGAVFLVKREGENTGV